MPKVFIGVGHGGTDSGAVSNGFLEKDLNLSIATFCKNKLEECGIEVLMSRNVDENEGLVERIRECNEYNPDVCLDIHNNAGGGDGIEIYRSVAGGKSTELAQNIENAVVNIGQNSRGVKTKLQTDGNDWFGFVRDTKAPAVLVECAFVDTVDVEIINTSDKQKIMGEAIAHGILKTLNFNFDNTPVETPVEIPVVPETPEQITATYRVFSKMWLDWVDDYNEQNCDGYAGIDNNNITAIQAKLSKGQLKYRVHLISGGWLDWVTDYNDINSDGFAGIKGKAIDLIQMQLIGLDDYDVQYRVSNNNNINYLDWVTDYNDINYAGFAGIGGKAIDKMQVRVVHK